MPGAAARGGPSTADCECAHQPSFLPVVE